MINCIFKIDADGKNRMVGYATVAYSSSDQDEVIIPITKTDLEALNTNWRDEYGNFVRQGDGLLVIDPIIA